MLTAQDFHMEQQEKTLYKYKVKLLFCKFISKEHSHTKSHNIPRSFKAMYINIIYELRAWVTCGNVCQLLSTRTDGYSSLKLAFNFLNREAWKMNKKNPRDLSFGSQTLRVA